jgi:hypothetical protein
MRRADRVAAMALLASPLIDKEETMPRDPDKERKVMDIVQQYDGRSITLDDSSITVSIPSDDRDSIFQSHVRSEGFNFHRESKPSGSHSADDNWYKILV